MLKVNLDGTYYGSGPFSWKRSEYSCYYLKELNLDDNGYIKLKFIKKKAFPNCDSNPINFVETLPKKQLRAVENISKTSVGKIFYLSVLPSTSNIIINGVNANGETRRYSFNKRFNS